MRRYKLLLPAILLNYTILQIILIPSLPLTYNDGLSLQVSQLINQGYHPYSQIFTLSSPLFVTVLGWLDKAGLSPGGFKLAFLLFGLLLLFNIAAITRALLGEAPALAAVLLLATTTTFLAESATTFLATIPALSIATLSLIFILRYSIAKQSGWVFTGGVIWGAALFLSPAVLSTGIIALIFIALGHKGNQELLTIKWHGLYKPVGVWLLGVTVALGIGLFLATPDIILGHILKDHRTLRENLSVVQANNFKLAGQFIAFNIWIFLFAAYAPARIYLKSNHPLWVFLIWAILSFVWFMVQVTPQLIDLTILLPPIAIIAGWSVVDIIQRLIYGSHSWHVSNSNRRLLLMLLGLVFVCIYFSSSWQRVARFYLRDFDTTGDLIQLEQRPDIVNFIQQHTTPEDCVIIDDPALAVAANRLPTPWLVQLSPERIASGLITQEQIIILAQENNCKATIFSKRKYTRPLSEFRKWAETIYPNQQEFTRTRIYFQ